MVVRDGECESGRTGALCALRMVPFGKHWRSIPFVFSFVLRCHEPCGSQKQAATPVATEKRACCGVSSPRSQVSVSVRPSGRRCTSWFNADTPLVVSFPLIRRSCSERDVHSTKVAVCESRVRPK